MVLQYAVDAVLVVMFAVCVLMGIRNGFVKSILTFVAVALWLAAAVVLQAVPVERVVPDLRGVVEHPALRLADDLLQRQIGEFGAFDHLVEVGHVRVVVLAVVIVRRLGAEVRLQRILSVWKLWQWTMSHSPLAILRNRFGAK